MRRSEKDENRSTERKGHALWLLNEASTCTTRGGVRNPRGGATPDLQLLYTHLSVRAWPHLIGQTQSHVSPLPYVGDGVAERLQHVGEPASGDAPVFNSPLLGKKTCRQVYK